MIFAEFDIEHAMFETGSYLLFIGMLVMIFCTYALKKNARTMNTGVLHSALLFYVCTSILSFLLRGLLMTEVWSEYLIFLLGVSAVCFAIQTIPYVIYLVGMEKYCNYMRELGAKLKTNAK